MQSAIKAEASCLVIFTFQYRVLFSDEVEPCEP
jgi:hypothetical protein